jgi:DNA-binding transcriptional regulator YiaG
VIWHRSHGPRWWGRSGRVAGAEPTVHLAGEDLSDLVLRLRGRTGLTQRDLAARLGSHVRSVQLWEPAPATPTPSGCRR